MDETPKQHECAVSGCTAKATRQDEVVGKHLRIAHVELPKATIRVAAWLCDAHELNDTGRIHLDL
ncbi:hypothetical protein BH93_27115 (plasmid) [Rhodococcoides fascians A25f]|uniref:hypothetical protein n=1 Tax=Rhodococcoides fascians TaxID=1828 RepID=UPI00055AC78F|nr:hypothetical protein [Rhodococcus fascians]QII09247.1 hypothetical protein BH93_27115 [Rhodococcus fascians A25f]